VADTLGWVSYRAGRYPEALVLLEEAGRGLPDSQEVQYHLGMARAKMGMLDPARQALRKALASPEEFAGREEARLRLASLDDAGAESVAELEARIGEQPRDVLLHLRLARRHEAAGALEEAAEAYRAALGINPDHLEALKALARLNLGPRGSGEAALEHARKARTLAPGDAEAAALLGRAALRQGDYPWAYRLLQEALSAFGEDVVVWESLGRASYHVGRISEARRAFERVVELAPEDSLARRFLVLTDPARGEWGSLEGEVEAQLRRDPDDLPALMARGRMRQEGGDREGAMEVFRGILERHPQFPPALVALATLLGADSERLREAYELAVTARELLPGDPGVARALGILSYRRDDAEYAAELLEEWEGAGRLDPEGLYYLGMSYLGTGRRQEGRQALARALEAGLEGALAESAAARLSGD